MATNTPQDAPDSAERGLLDRALGLFADVHAGEGGTAVLLTVNVFLLLTCYYLLKTAREPLILASGAEVKSYSAAGQAILLIFFTQAYGAIAARVNRMRLITIVTLFFTSNLVIFFALGVAHIPVGIPFFLWVGVFNYSIIAQFWSFAADLYTEEQGKRLFAILGIGSTVGAVAGSGIAKELIKPVGVYGLMLAAAVLLLLCLGVTMIVDRREIDRDRKSAKPRGEEHLGKEGGFSMLIKDKYLLCIGALTLLLNWVNSSGEYILDRTLLQAAHEGAAQLAAGTDVAKWTDEYIGSFKASYFLWVNVISVTLQLFVVSRVIKYVGVRMALFIMPIISLTGYTALTFVPVLGIIFAVKLAENSLDYSLQNTARQALWLLTSRDAKYKAKSVIDTFLVRSGDVCSAIVVWIGTTLKFSTRSFIVVNAVLALCWLGVVFALSRAHKARTEKLDSERQKTPILEPA